MLLPQAHGAAYPLGTNLCWVEVEVEVEAEVGSAQSRVAGSAGNPIRDQRARRERKSLATGAATEPPLFPFSTSTAKATSPW